MCSCKDLPSFNYKGLVTSVNERLLQFTVDHKFKVYLFNIGMSKEIRLPTVNENVILRKIIMPVLNCMCLLQKSMISCSKYTLLRSDNSVFKSHLFCCMSINDMHQIEKHCETLKKLSVFSDNFLKEKCIFATVEDIIFDTFTNLRNTNKVRKQCINNNLFLNVNLVFPQKLKVCDDLATPTAIPDYTFSIQQSSAEDFLIGYLCFFNNSLVLSDSNNNICCLITSNQENLSKYLNKFVLVKNYIVMSEYFSENDDVRSLKYVYFKIEDSVILNLEYMKLNMEEDSYPIISKCQILHKGPIYFNSKKNIAEYWLYIRITVGTMFECLISSAELLNMYPEINIGDSLLIEYPKKCWILEELKKYHTRENDELKRVFPKVPAFVLPSLFLFKLVKNETSDTNVLTLEDAIKNQKGESLVSFIAVVIKKCLSVPLSSRTASVLKKDVIDVYGTPGSKTHTLRFQSLTHPEIRCMMYLNNWELIMCPFGLIEGMKVIVRYAMPQKSYFKSCVLTNFEPVNYEPLYKFNSCFEFVNNAEWGPMTIFSTGNRLPSNILCWCEIYKIYMKTVRLRSKCQHCKKNATAVQEFCCGQANFITDLYMRFTAVDAVGLSTITTSCIKFIQILMDLEENHWEFLTDCMRKLKVYDFQPLPKKSGQKIIINSPHQLFLNVLHLYFEFMTICYPDIDIKARKTSNEDKFVTWCGIEARRAQL